MEVARETNKFVRKTLKSNSMIRFVPKKKQMLAIVEENKGARALVLKKMLYNRRETRLIHVLPPFPCDTRKVKALLELGLRTTSFIFHK